MKSLPEHPGSRSENSRLKVVAGNALTQSPSGVASWAPTSHLSLDTSVEQSVPLKSVTSVVF